MKYKNKFYRKQKKTFPLNVKCNHCKTPILVYAKGGHGNLIKLQLPRIIESNVDLRNLEGDLHCYHCDVKLANRGFHNNNLTFFIIRGQINSQRLHHY